MLSFFIGFKGKKKQTKGVIEKNEDFFNQLYLEIYGKWEMSMKSYSILFLLTGQVR